MYLLINTIKSDSNIFLFEGQNIIEAYLWRSENNQSEELLLSVDKLLRRNNKSINDIKGIAVISGPGSYTGIRVGVSVANSIAYSKSIRVVSANILDLLGEYYLFNNPKSKKVIALVNAIYDKYYFARCQRINGDIVKKYGNDSIDNISENKENEYILLEEDNVKKNYKKIGMNNSELQKFIADYFSQRFDENKFQKKYIKPFYINKPNIT